VCPRACLDALKNALLVNNKRIPARSAIPYSAGTFHVPRNELLKNIFRPQRGKVIVEYTMGFITQRRLFYSITLKIVANI
jgi:hypothetical protein